MPRQQLGQALGAQGGGPGNRAYSSIPREPHLHLAGAEENDSRVEVLVSGKVKCP
jgi:hypothetical protein